MHSFRTLTLAIVVSVLSACSHVSPKYGISANNVESIRSNTSATEKIGIAPFTTFEAGLASIGCRAAGPVKPSDGQTFEKYIQEAFVSELKLAGVYSTDATRKMAAHLDYINFNSNIGAGKWQIDMTLSGPDIEPFKVSSIYPFSTNWGGDVACNQVATAFPAAVQDLIGRIVTHPTFKSFISGKK